MAILIVPQYPAVLNLNFTSIVIVMSDRSNQIVLCVTFSSLAVWRILKCVTIFERLLWLSIQPMIKCKFCNTNKICELFLT